MKHGNWFRVAASLMFALLLAVAAKAQNATLTGTVSDESGAVMPGVEITVKNVETGIQRGTTSDAQGRWNVPSLNPGTYEVTSTLTGFDTFVRQGITLTVGQIVNLPLTMRVGSVQEQVTVTGEAPLVDVSTSNVSGVVEERRIQELPLNGRDFSQLALVQPAAVSVRFSDQGASKGFGTRVALAGSRVDQTGWQLDGTNINSVGNFGTPGSASGVMMGVDAVREFRVLSGGYSAEYGGYSGGMIQMVTKSGTNSYHGTAYEFLRNDNFDAANFFNNAKPDVPGQPPADKKAEFRRNQFGGSVGGPIRKDKAFFFGNFEALRQATTNDQLVEAVPNADAHRGLLPNGTQVNVAASVRPYLDLYPLPNGRDLGDGKGELFTPTDRIINENFFVARGDYYLTPNQTIFGRFQFDNGSDEVPTSLGISHTAIISHTRYATLQYERIWSPTLLSSTRGAYNRTNISPTIELQIDYPQNLYFLGKPYPPTISITGFASLQVSPNDTTYRIQNLYDISHGMTWNSTSHSMKFGVNYQKVGFNTSGPAAGAFGSFTWSSLQNFLTDANLQEFAVEAIGSDTARTTMQHVFGFYLQDDWRLKSNFTLNLGLRYEPWTAPGEKWGRVSTIKKWLEATRYDTPENGTNTYFDSPGEMAWSPRVGFAWDVAGNGKTAIRGGFGIFHQIILSNYLNTISRKNPPYAATLSATQPGVNLAGASAYALANTPALLSPNLSLTQSANAGVDALAEFIQYDLNSPYDLKYNFTIEREVMPNLSASIGYIGTRGNHLFRLADGNSVIPEIVGGRPFVAPRPNAQARWNRPNLYLDQATVRNSDAQSFYNAMIVEVKKRFSHGFQLQSSYTYSKNIDDATTGLALTDYNEGANSQVYDTKVDRGLSSIHLAHNWVVNGLWSVPSPFKSGVLQAALGGWKLSGIFSTTSGPPFSVQISNRNADDGSRSGGRQRPELDASRTPDSITSGTTAGCGSGAATIAPGPLGGIDRYYDPCAFFLPPAGFYGSAGRNTLIGPAFTNLDFSLAKNFAVPINEGSNIEFKADFFNIFNHTNFARPNVNAMNGTNRQYLTDAGRITNTVGRERQLQFGLKLTF